MGKWSVHHMMREEVGAPSRGRRPLWAAAPLLLYKYGWSTSSLLAHLLALWLVSSPSSPLIHRTSYGLGEALLK